jgi:hypothetical protein
MKRILLIGPGRWGANHRHRRKYHHVSLFHLPVRTGWNSCLSAEFVIYIRNLALIRRRKFALTAAVPSQRPRELS